MALSLLYGIKVVCLSPTITPNLPFFFTSSDFWVLSTCTLQSFNEFRNYNVCFYTIFPIGAFSDREYISNNRLLFKSRLSEVCSWSLNGSGIWLHILLLSRIVDDMILLSVF